MATFVSLRTLRGFTLIELLVVIAIIGILASVVLASLNSARERARNSAIVAATQEIQKALDLYFLQYGSYPRSNGWDCLAADTNGDGNCWAGSDAAFQHSNNHADLTNLATYINFSSIPTGADPEGILYGARNSYNGYELVYTLEGTTQECPAGFNRNGNEASSGKTSCTICHNYTNATWCVDRF